MTTININQVKPLAGYVLVKPADKQTKTASGIYLPDSSEEKPQHGTVLACGDAIWESGVKEIKSPVKKGDQVIYKKWGGNEIKVDGKEMLLVKEEDLLAVLED